MRMEDMTPETLEKAKRCETREVRMASMEEGGIELTDEQLEGISGGHYTAKKCPASKRNDGDHNWRETGNTRPGRYIIDDVEKRCTYCGETIWAQR